MLANMGAAQQGAVVNWGLKASHYHHSTSQHILCKDSNIFIIIIIIPAEKLQIWVLLSG